MAKNKSYRVSFFRINNTANAAKTVFSLMSDFIDGTKSIPVLQIGEYEFELRSLVLTGQVFRGEFAKYRKHGLPNIGKPATKKDKKIPLQPDEGLIEKNYFLIYKNRHLLVWQNNRTAAGVSTFTDYLTNCCNTTVALDDLIYSDSVKQMLSNDWTLKEVDATFVRPQDPSLYPTDNFSQSLLSVLASSSGYKLNISISGEGRGSGKKAIASKIKRAIANLVNDEYAPAAKLKFDEVERPIDLVTDRIRERIEVVLPDERYPLADDVYTELVKAYDRKKVELTHVLGEVR